MPSRFEVGGETSVEQVCVEGDRRWSQGRSKRASTLIVSHRHRFVLLSPWKTASSTSHVRLSAFNESPYSRFYHFNERLQRVVHQHITYSDFARLPEGRKGYLTGCFVRNPYDRVYSGFLQLQRDIQQQPSKVFPDPWVKSLVMRQLSDNFAQLAASDFQFDKWLASVEDHQIYEVGRNSSFPLHPAHYWTGVSGKVQVDFVGKVERYEMDFRHFCDQVNVHPPVDRIDRNVSAAGQVYDCGNYRYTVRMKHSSIDKINNLFSKDFDIFDYERII